MSKKLNIGDRFSYNEPLQSGYFVKIHAEIMNKDQFGFTFKTESGLAFCMYKEDIFALPEFKLLPARASKQSCENLASEKNDNYLILKPGDKIKFQIKDGDPFIKGTVLVAYDRVYKIKTERIIFTVEGNKLFDNRYFFKVSLDYDDEVLAENKKYKQKYNFGDVIRVRVHDDNHHDVHLLCTVMCEEDPRSILVKIANKIPAFVSYDMIVEG